jgi:hypothetical protein
MLLTSRVNKVTGNFSPDDKTLRTLKTLVWNINIIHLLLTEYKHVQECNCTECILISANVCNLHPVCLYNSMRMRRNNCDVFFLHQNVKVRKNPLYFAATYIFSLFLNKISYFTVDLSLLRLYICDFEMLA